MKRQYIHEADILLHIQADGNYETDIQADGFTKLNIVVDKHINASLFITYHGVKAELLVQTTLEASSHIELLHWNKMQDELSFHDTLMANKDSVAHIGYGDIEQGSTTYDMYFNLLESGSDIKVTSVSISSQQKHYQMLFDHQVPHTKAIMENFAIVRSQGNYRMEATGQIQAGAQGSESHQATRILTMAQDQKSEVIPLLLIDENEVKASHATTLGQPDENQLYYLQSRGLSRQEALGLLTIGYIMPIVEVIQNEAVKQQLVAEIEEKVMANV